MFKKVLSGVLAFSLIAGAGTVAAGAIKLGDVNDDGEIDISDAVAIINHVNAVSELTGLEERAADIDMNMTVDIEDAVRIISYINGNTDIDDVEIEPEEAVARITLLDTGDSFEVKIGDTIPMMYGKGDGLSADPTQSWYLKSFGYVEVDGELYERVVDDILCGEISLQHMIENATPVTGDMEFSVKFALVPSPPIGYKTLKTFDAILDDNYYMRIKANAYCLTSIRLEGELKQKDSDNSYLNAKIEVLGSSNYSDIYAIDGKKYYVRDADKQEYSEGPSGMESFLDIQSIFKNLASDRDNLKFLNERKDEDTGYTVERFSTVLVLGGENGGGMVFDVNFDAYFDDDGNFKRLMIMDEDFRPGYVYLSSIYLNTTELEFEPEFNGDYDTPAFDSWTVVNTPSSFF